MKRYIILFILIISLLWMKGDYRQNRMASVYSTSNEIYLHQLGYELSEREKNWLMNTYTAFPSGPMLNVFSSSGELLKYYEFRKKYPYTTISNSCY